MNETSVVVVGIGGYGNTFVSALLDSRQPSVRFAGVVDPAPERSRRLADLRSSGVPICTSLEEFYAKYTADLAVIASPIHLHRPQTELALARGSHVLCEKPLCAVPDDIEPMKRARDAAGRLVAIGYQWSFAPAIHTLKRDVMAGTFGAPKRLRALVLWPRTEQYYGRNNWAGQQQDARGNWILDSPVNNATAHYLHNMLYVLGESTDRSAVPTKVEAELYRANKITNYDTAALRVHTDRGAELIFCVSHAVTRNYGPVFAYEFEKAVVRHGETREIVAHFADGSTRNYGSPDTDPAKKMWDVIQCMRCNGRVPCGIEAASSQTHCVWMAQQAGVKQFPPSSVCVEGEPGNKLTYVPGLDDVLTQCYERGALPQELGARWT